MPDESQEPLTDENVELYNRLATALLVSMEENNIDAKAALYTLTFASIHLANKSGIRMKTISARILEYYKERML